MGPGRKLPTLGHISFTELRDAYSVQASGLLDGGVDLLIVETCQDLLQTKAALAAIFALFEERRTRVPVIAQVTIEVFGTMLNGTEIAAALTALAPFPDRRCRHELRHWAKAHDGEYSLHLRKHAAAGVRPSKRRSAFSSRRQDALRRDSRKFHGASGPLRK